MDEERSMSALQRAQTKIHQLQNELSTFKEEGAEQLASQVPSNQDGKPTLTIPKLSTATIVSTPSAHHTLSASSSEMIAKLNTQLIQVYLLSNRPF